MRCFSLRSKSASVQTTYNVISAVIRTGISFFTMPLFTRILGTEQYGLYSIYLSWYNILICVISLGCGQGLGTGMYKYKDDYPRFRSSILLGGTLMCGLVSVIGAVFFFPLSPRIGYSYPLYILLFLEASASFVTTFVNGVWTFEKKAGLNMIMSLATVVLTTGLSLFLLIYWPGKPEELYFGRVLGMAIPSIIVAIIAWIGIFMQKPAGFVKEYWIYSFGFGIPLIFHTLSHNILSSSDRLMMEHFGISNSEIGIYSFFYSLVGILGTIQSALNTSWVPFLYEDLDKKEYSKLNIRVKNYTQIYVIISCGFILLAREVTKLFADERYWSGMSVVPIIVMVMYCIYIYQFPANYEFFKSKPRIIAYCTGIAAVENIILNAVMIPKWGMYGAAVATLLSYMTLALAHIIVVTKWKEEKYPLTWKPIIVGLIVELAFCGLYYLLADYWIIRWGIGAAIGGYLLISVYRRRTVF